MSESRRRSTKSGHQDANSQTNGRRSERGMEVDEEEGGAGPSSLPEEDDDPARRRELRSRYRDLINSVQRKYMEKTGYNNWAAITDDIDFILNSLM